jgi:G3E family GTPase
MNELKKIPVVILNGFLGSGKTTLFRSLLAQSKKKEISVCSIVNDMSELDVDGELIGYSDIIEDDNSKLESISSCVLSSKIGVQKLNEAIKNILLNHNPELIIIETSGSCHPMPLIEYFKKQKHLSLQGVFVLIDSLMLKHDFNYGEKLIPQMQQNVTQGKRDTVNLLVEQIMFCSHLFITKSDRIEKEQLPNIATYIQQINPLASVHAVQFGRLTIESLFELEEYNYSNVLQLTKELKTILASEEDSNSPYDLATLVIKDDRPFHPQRLWDVCHQYLDKKIYRSKGFFWLASRDKHSLLWQQAAGGISLELIGSWRAGIIEDKNHGLSSMEIEQLKEFLLKEPGRFGDRHCDLTVIGDKSQVNQFTERLKSCFLTEEEITLWKKGYEFKDPWPKKLVKIEN